MCRVAFHSSEIWLKPRTTGTNNPATSTPATADLAKLGPAPPGGEGPNARKQAKQQEDGRRENGQIGCSDKLKPHADDGQRQMPPGSGSSETDAKIQGHRKPPGAPPTGNEPKPKFKGIGANAYTAPASRPAGRFRVIARTAAYIAIAFKAKAKIQVTLKARMGFSGEEPQGEEEREKSDKQIGRQ